MLILATASSSKAVAATVKGLRETGQVLVVGVSLEPIEVSDYDLVFGGRSVEGSLTGDPAPGDKTLKFSVLSGISAMIETMPLEKAPEAYAKMMAGKARFRMVLTMQS
jgi:alcohol dehydrogenase, propanol-preferring